MHVLVTGGAGFIGSHLVDRLLIDGHEVRVLDDFSTGHRENLMHHERLAVTQGSVADFVTVDKLMQGVEWVFHEAAVASVPKSVDDPLGTHGVNYLGTLHVLEAARRHGVARVVFAASAAAYGDLPGLPKREDMPVSPLSPYAVDKMASEYACYVYHRLYGLATVCLRYFNVFGPRQDPSSPYSGVISIFMDRLRRGETPTIYGDGGQIRDFVYVADVVEANLRAVASEPAAGRVINVASGRPVTLLELLTTIGHIAGVDVRPRFEKPRVGDIRESLANISLAEELMDWRPGYSLREGLEELLASSA